ncbi:PqqD family protein [Acidicapsa dinghuensis]|uniref:PqqD family protein n=1 Tax=Acidicapsa dinghuensis TaxID=2218256 RepID=A0ABW1ECV6_9BACT|nr:PqqD family protein [Acidicapsa dinghuensis]
MRRDASHLRTVANADGAVILDTRRGRISTLNSTGAYVWAALERGDEVGQIAAELARETGEHVDALERDVRQFISALMAEQLLIH